MARGLLSRPPNSDDRRPKPLLFRQNMLTMIVVQQIIFVPFPDDVSAVNRPHFEPTVNTDRGSS